MILLCVYINSVCAWVCGRVCVHAWVYVCVRLCVSVSVHAWVYVCVRLCVCVCVSVCGSHMECEITLDKLGNVPLVRM